MNTTMWKRLAAVAAFSAGLLIGCSETQEPATTTIGEAALTTENVVNQDLVQLSDAGIPAGDVYGVFSIGWNQFVGPAIQPVGTIGKAFAVVHTDIIQTGLRPAGIDVGTVSLTYVGGSTDLVKRIMPNGGVLYSTFDRGLREPASLPVNIPFIGDGQYTFSVSGSETFAPATLTLTAPSSLIEISHASGETVSLSSDLTVSWTGGVANDSVVIRVVPHLASRQLQQPMNGGSGPRVPRGQQGGGSGGMGPGPHHGQGPHQGPGAGALALPHNVLVKVVPNSGAITLTSTDLQSVVNGSSATEIMIHVAQVADRIVQLEGKSYALLMKNADRIVLSLQ